MTQAILLIVPDDLTDHTPAMAAAAEHVTGLEATVIGWPPDPQEIATITQAPATT